MYNKKPVFTAAAIAILLFGVGMTTLGSVAPWLQSRFLLDETETGTLFSILPIGILTGSLVFGPICDRYGFKYLLMSACLLMAIGFEGIAFSHSVSLLRIAVFLTGVGGGAINGATSAVVADMSEDSKGANLSLLGLFFGIGALGMPFLLAILNNLFSYEEIIASFGLITATLAVFYLFVPFPPSKLNEALSLRKISGLFTDGWLLLIAFFLFCQSSFEGIMNNWTTSYLIQQRSVDVNASLYALSLYVVGYTIVRLLLGTVLRKIPVRTLVLSSIFFAAIGISLLTWSATYALAVTGLIIVGAGLSGGFPLMLGLVAGRYADISGTAFSFLLVIALTGNMLVNYFVGFMAGRAGIQHLTSVAFVESALMLLFALLIFRKANNK